MTTTLTAISQHALDVTKEGVERENWHTAARVLIAHTISQRMVPDLVGYSVTHLSDGEARTEPVVGFVDGGACTVDRDGFVEILDTPANPAYVVWSPRQISGGKRMSAQRAEAMLRETAEAAEGLLRETVELRAQAVAVLA